MAPTSSALELLRSYGLKATPQRQVILECVQRADHPRADDIYGLVSRRIPGISLATVYNTLNLLVEHGIIHQFPGEAGASRFERDTRPHYHAICERCGAIADVPPTGLQELETAVAQHTGFQVRRHRLEFHGLCQQCQQHGRVIWRPGGGGGGRAQPAAAPRAPDRTCRCTAAAAPAAAEGSPARGRPSAAAAAAPL